MANNRKLSDEKVSYSALAKLSWMFVYPLDKTDSVRAKVENEKTLEVNAKAINSINYSVRSFWAVVVAKFLGMPLDKEIMENHENGMDLFSKSFKKMIGWKQEKNTDTEDSSNLLLDIIGSTGLFLFNILLRIPFLVVTHTLQFFFEYVPFTLMRFSWETANRLKAYAINEQGSHPYLAGLAVLGSGFFRGLEYLLKGVWLLGRTVSSPADSMRAGWNYGKERDSKVLSWTLMLLSALISTAVYVVAFPIGLKMAALQLPQIMSLIHQSSFLVTAGNYIGTALNPVLDLFGIGLSSASLVASSLIAGLVTVIASTKALADDYYFEIKNPSLKSANVQYAGETESFVKEPKLEIKPEPEAIKLVESDQGLFSQIKTNANHAWMRLASLALSLAGTKAVAEEKTIEQVQERPQTITLENTLVN